MIEEGAAVSERASSGDLLRSVLEPWAEHLSAQTWEETHGKRITTKQGIEFPSFKTEKSQCFHQPGWKDIMEKNP